ncbi:MAG: dihydroorotate dehydrogenase electron transfer subunit [Thermaerobacter sp.]|nr:dihydroorotate dehydrogenase electron transfer subunit [Thermaerobacter sp.]
MWDLLVCDVLRPAQDYVELRLQAPQPIDLTPGQFFMLRAGDTPDTYLPRAFSWYRSEDPSSISFLFRVQGPGTAHLASLKAGESLSAMGPLGQGFPLPARPIRAALLGGGVGVPPLWGLARALLAAGSEVLALIGARSQAHLVGVEEVRALGAQVLVATDDGTAGHRGPLTELLVGERVDALYACGPEGMLRRVQEISLAGGPPAHLALEAPMACGYGVCLGCVVERTHPDPSLGEYGRYARVCREGPVFPAGEVRF